MGNFTYLIINILCISFPIIWSFEKKMFFFSKWKFVFISIAIVGTVFLIWDSFFTYIGVWGFNPNYLIGIYLYNIPLEEFLFFITVPFASLFIYESVKFYFNDKLHIRYSGLFTIVFIVGFAVLGCLNTQKWYTTLAFTGSAIFLCYKFLVLKKTSITIFLVSYLIVLIPFFIVNSALTGLFTENPIVWYNNEENLGIRLGTIPIEDLGYNFLMLLMHVTFYERFQNQQKIKN